MKEEVLPYILINFVAVSQNMLESYVFTIALRSNGNQASGPKFALCARLIKICNDFINDAN